MKLLTLTGPHRFPWKLKYVTVEKVPLLHTAATEKYERTVKRKFLADTHSAPNVPLIKKIIEEDTDDDTNGEFLKRSL